MVPTELGKQLYVQIIASIENLEQVETGFNRLTYHKQATLKIGSPKEFFQRVLVSKLYKSSSKLWIQFGLTTDLMQELEQGQLNFVIATHKTKESENVVYEAILKETFIIIGSANLDIADFKKAINQNDKKEIEHWLLQQNWLSYGSNLAFIRRFWLQNFLKRPRINPKIIIPDLYHIALAVAEGNGISIVSDYLVKDLLETKVIFNLWSGAEPTTNILYLAYDKTKVSVAQVAEMKMMINDVS
ncbi:DNA-binding transcriptional regulator, LysR family [bacterium A37T11]|nr:DNA-binding transcriptional regulator, LysR family [bacterium A37T11]